MSVYNEPETYAFQDRDGHDGKVFETSSRQSDFLIIECEDRLRTSLVQEECEFAYYVIDGSGYFKLDGVDQEVNKGDLVVVPAGTQYTFGGLLKMLLVNTPKWSEAQEKVSHES